MIKPFTDERIWQRIFSHPSVRRWAGDDFGVGEMRSDFLYLTDETEGSCITVHPLGYVCYSVHLSLLPRLWGKGIEIADEAELWIFNNTPCQKIQSIIPVYNRLALKIARDAGMKEEGVLCKSISRWFRLHDQILFGIEKGD